MDEQGNYSEDDWNTIYTEGGAGVIPSYFGGEYGPPGYRRHPTTAYAWLCSFIGLLSSSHRSSHWGSRSG